MSKSLVQMIEIILKERQGQRIPARDLAKLVVEQNPQWADNKRKKSKNVDISSGGNEELSLQVQSEIGSNKYAIERHKNLRMTEDRPRRYYYSSLSEVEEIENAEDSGNQDRFSEHDLYPLLSKYLEDELSVVSKRIDEKTSQKKLGPKGNHWLHPDLIGFEVKSQNWSDTIKKLVESRADKNTRLWSFEVKKLINRSNVRETFFQALSNSSWANFAYLVAAEVSGSGTLEELRMLSSQHGVGIIQISASAETESGILIQATEKLEIDWTAADRLSSINPDAEAVFKQVRIYHQSGEVTRSFWD